MNLTRVHKWGLSILTFAAISGGLVVVAPASQSLPDPTFTATPTSAMVGDSVEVSSVTTCLPPQGAGDWTAIVNVAQGSNDQVSFDDLAVADDGSWSGSITLPAGLTPGAASLTASCFDAFHDVADEVDYTPVALTVTAPTPTTSASSTTSSSTTSSTQPPAAPAVDPAAAVPGTPALTG